MNKQEILERQRFEDTIRNESADTGLPHSERVNAARLLMRHGRTYARIQEETCNGCGTRYGESNESFSRRQAEHEARIEKREAQLERRIREIVASLGPGFGVVFNGDPRGSTVKITVPSGKYTDWGKEGICVPGS